MKFYDICVVVKQTCRSQFSLNSLILFLYLWQNKHEEHVVALWKRDKFKLYVGNLEETQLLQGALCKCNVCARFEQLNYLSGVVGIK